MGKIPKDRLEEDEERHNLYCYLGQPEKFKPTITKKNKMADGDIFILCTKGVWEYAGTAEYLDALEEAKEPEEVCGSIEEFILSRKAEVLSSYTISCIFIDKIYQNTKRKKKIMKIAMAIAIPVLLIVITILITLYVLHKKNVSKIEQIMVYKENGIEFFGMESYDRAAKEFESALSLVKEAKYKKSTETGREIEELIVYDKLVQLLVDAALEGEKGNYSKAVEKYNYAVTQSKGITDLTDEAKQAIETLREEAMTYYDVLELINKGDKEYSIGLYNKAIAAYKEAIQKASSVYYTTGKKEASDKLAEVEADLLYQENKKIEEQADTYKESAKKKKEAGNLTGAKEDYETARELYLKAGNQEKADEMKESIDSLLLEAKADEKDKYTKTAELKMKLGDAYYDAEDYESASEAYLLAIEAYSNADMSEKLNLAESKYLLSESMKGTYAKQKRTASDYMAKGKEKEELSDYQGARVLYELALTVYQELELSSEVISVKEKIKGLDAVITVASENSDEDLDSDGDTGENKQSVMNDEKKEGSSGDEGGLSEEPEQNS